MQGRESSKQHEGIFEEQKKKHRGQGQRDICTTRTPSKRSDFERQWGADNETGATRNSPPCSVCLKLQERGVWLRVEPLRMRRKSPSQTCYSLIPMLFEIHGHFASGGRKGLRLSSDVRFARAGDLGPLQPGRKPGHLVRPIPRVWSRGAPSGVATAAAGSGSDRAPGG